MDGTRELPGGRIHATAHWVVEHCIGPLGLGTLIVKPIRHCVHFWEMSEDEARELGPLLRLVAATIHAILAPDQVYVCLWSHAGWEPGHLHFVLQPSWNRLRVEHERPGPFLQTDMARADVRPGRQEIETFVEQAQRVIRELGPCGGDAECRRPHEPLTAPPPERDGESQR